MIDVGIRFGDAGDRRPLVHAIGPGDLTKCERPYVEPCEVVQGPSLQDVCLTCLAQTMREDPRVRMLLDSSSWLEVVPHPLGFVVEYHLPRRVASAGYVDAPTVARGPLAVALRRVLDGSIHDPGVVLPLLQTRVMEKGEAEPDL